MPLKQQTYLTLLRGINVGGHNVIPMSDLRACFESLRATNVATYIQSGNVLFDTDQRDAAQLTRAIEQALSSQFSYNASVIVMSRVQYLKALKSAHEGWGTDESKKHNALFTCGSITAKKALDLLPPRDPAIDQVSTGPRVIFWSVDRETEDASRWTKAGAAAVYKELTVRNHKTVFKLRDRLADR